MRPCHRAVANAPPERPAASISLRRSMLPSPPNRGFGLWIRILEVTYAFTFVTARRLAHHPMDGFVDPLHALRFLRACDPGYRALTFTLVGLPPTEHISLLLDMRLGIPLPEKGVCSSNHGRSFDRRDVWDGLNPPDRLQTSRGRQCTGSKKTRKTTLRSEGTSLLKKSLTEPALLEMSGNPASRLRATLTCF